MQKLIAYMLLSFIALCSIVGIAGLTCWGCFPAFQNSWWTFGVSTYLALCCCIAVTFALLDVRQLIRMLILVAPCCIVAALIGTGMFLNSVLPRMGPPRKADLFQLLTLTPLICVSIATPPFFLRIYRGYHFSKLKTTKCSLHTTRWEYIFLAMSLILAFVLPLGADVINRHVNGESAFFTVYAIAGAVFSVCLVMPATFILMRFGWITFWTSACIALIAVFVSISTIEFQNNVGLLTPKEILVYSTTVVSGLFMFTIFLAAIRLLGFRWVTPPLSRRVSELDSRSLPGPLDDL